MAENEYQVDYSPEDVRNMSLDFLANLGIGLMGCFLLIGFVVVVYFIVKRK